VKLKSKKSCCSRKGHGKKKKKLWIAIELEISRNTIKPVKLKRFVSVGGEYLRSDKTGVIKPN
jgi:hypothetical protein